MVHFQCGGFSFILSACTDRTLLEQEENMTEFMENVVTESRRNIDKTKVY